MSAMTEQGMSEETAAQLLAMMREQEERRARRNRILVWVAIAAVVVGGIVAAVVKHQRDEARSEQRVREMYCDMTREYGTAGYYDCIAG